MRNKRFICVFPNGKNVHLVKDVGMIPYGLYKWSNFDSYIAFYENKEDLEYLDSEVSGLKYLQMSRLFKNDYLNMFIFLLKNLFRFDVIMMFHPNQISLPIAFIFKILSLGKTKIYFKMDLNSDFDFSKLEEMTLKKKVYNFLMKSVDVLTVESYDDWLEFKRIDKFDVSYLPNGFVRNNKNSEIEKENVLLTVGRLGTFQKDTETLLESFALSNPLNYKLHLIGPIEPDFQAYVTNYFIRFPFLCDKVKFLGSIIDRSELLDHYQRARVFVLTSRYEGFPLVFLEAISSGCFIVSSNFASSRDVTDNQRYGRLFEVENVSELAEIFSELDRGEISIVSQSEIRKYALRKYSLDTLMNKLNNLLN